MTKVFTVVSKNCSIVRDIRAGGGMGSNMYTPLSHDLIFLKNFLTLCKNYNPLSRGLNFTITSLPNERFKQ